MKFTEKIKSIFLKKGGPLTADSVNFGYKNKEVLKELSLDIGKGKIVAIIGKSGSGKSTFLKLVTGVVSRKFKGKIKILGKSRAFSKEEIGYIPQEVSLVPDLTLRENIMLFGGLSGLSEEQSLQNGKKLLDKLHLQEDLSNLPTELSGGQQVRLNIVVSLLHNPSVLILDEPFVGLDFFNRRLVWHFLESLVKQKKTVILTTHLLSEVEEHADEILVLNRGRIDIRGNSKDIKEKLKVNKMLEIKFEKILDSEKIHDINEYCRKKTTKLVDHYDNIALFSVENENQKKNLIDFLNKNKMKHSIVNYKVPNLDEAFMRQDYD